MHRIPNGTDPSTSTSVVLAAVAAAAVGETEVMRERAAAADDAMVAATATAVLAHQALAQAVANEIDAAAWAMHSAATPEERRNREARRAVHEATEAAETAALGLSPVEFAQSDLIASRIAEVVAAKIALVSSDAAMLATSIARARGRSGAAEQ